MVKKGKTKAAKTGARLKKGEKYVCDACGMAVTVNKECGCNPCDITCCGQSMVPSACCC